VSKVVQFRKLTHSLCLFGLAIGLSVNASSAQISSPTQSGTTNGKGTPVQGNRPPHLSPRPFDPDGIPDSAPFRKLDTIIGPYVNLNVVPFSPIALTPDGNTLAVVNTHANLVRLFDSTDPNPVNWTLIASYKTAWGPVSAGFFINPGCQPELLLTCSNSDSLLWMDYTGRVQGLLGLPGEPSDLLIDQTRKMAWVSCLGSDVVVEVDLQFRRIRAEYPIPSKHPAFLSFENGNTGSVIVAPMLSGNNTTVERGPALFNAGPNGILDLSQETQGLPDEDLFRLSPADATVSPVVIGAGTILNDHAENPVTGEWWMLGTDAKNAQFQSEPEANGIFSENRLTIIGALPPLGGAPVVPNRFIDLDDSNPLLPGQQAIPTRTVGQPYALEFDRLGNGYITGMLTNNITQYDQTGTWVKEWNVGSIPRGLKTIRKGSKDFLAAYCWGNNKIEVYEPAVGTGIVVTLDVGPDPTHPKIRNGRTLYYSAANSMNNNMSCNTCHIDGFSDMLAWDLSDRRVDINGAHTIPVDDKGPLITQTLRSIKGQNPYHWRGERGDLIAFNGAFPGLLGGPPLDTTPDGDFDNFEAFVMHLQERANPFESVTREILDSFVPDTFPPGTSAVRGQDLFYDKNSLPSFSCEDCHTLPSGTRNATFRDEFSATLPGRSHFAVAPLLSFWRKLQPNNVSIEYASGQTDKVPVLGTGLSPTGLADDLQDFVLQGAFILKQQEKHDVAAFLMQLDTGIPPIMHKGVRIGYGGNCIPPVPFAKIVPDEPIYPNLPGLTPKKTLGNTTPAAPTLAGSVQPELAPGVEDEQTANSIAITKLLSSSAPDEFQLVVVADYLGTLVEGVFDSEANSLDLKNDGVLAATLTVPAIINAFNAGSLSGMIFPMPRGMGDLFMQLDPDDGTIAVIPGPGAASTGGGVDPDPFGDGQAATASDSSKRTSNQFESFGQPFFPDGTPVKLASGVGPTIEHFKVVYVTSRVAKVVFYTDVMARSVTEYTPIGGSMRQHFEPMPTRAHMVFLRDLDPSKTWDLRIVAVDANLDMGEMILPDAFTSLSLLIPQHVIANKLGAQAPLQNSGGTLRFFVDINVTRLVGTASLNFTPLFNVLVHDVTNNNWREDAVAVAAPLTDVLGDSSIEFIVPGLNVGDEVTILINDILPPGSPVYTWSLPDTRSVNRSLTLTYTGTGP
jgi:hypothetical protein